MLHSSQPMLSGLRNSVIISACTAALCTYFSVMTAYAIHSYDFKGKKAIFTFILAIMMIPTQVSALGFIRLITKMHLMDNFIPLIIPAIASPVTFFYMKQYMESNLPSSLIEAARIDGAGEFYTFNKVVLPLMVPAIAVQAIFSFVSSWNNYFTPALVLHDDKMKTLPILIAQLRAADWLKFDMGQVYAAIAFSIFPVIIVYLILSKCRRCKGIRKLSDPAVQPGPLRAERMNRDKEPTQTINTFSSETPLIRNSRIRLSPVREF